MAKIKTPPKPHLFRHRHKPRGVSPAKFEKTFWPYLPLILLIGSTLLLAIRGGAIPSNRPGSHVLGYANSMQIKNLLTDTNKARAAAGLKTLTISGQLDAAAQAKAASMAKLNYWSHAEPGGKPPWIFVAAQHYSYQVLGENLAAGFSNEQAVLNAWMASSEHRANLLNPNFNQAGFGVAQSPDFTAAGGGPMTIVVAYYAEPAGQINYAIAHSPKFSAATGANSSTSHAELALAGTGLASSATKLTVGLILVAAGVIIGRHGLAIRRAFKRGERFVAKHPLIDLGLIATIFIAYLLIQTAGFIK